ncbi:phosphoribosyltransferase family protein [Gracilimonas sp.]|jgi:pyrimidine operon attenuation protein/uracil phosphoribosyltransferase|uniref:phosphoribosyltransferase family protein n=1 Tax=Gracilimonas sp. TaxID=1974203 RepID=UPI0025C134BA|nr:phosphoribosyltransferase family protein [Gracilimonas sp.]
MKKQITLMNRARLQRTLRRIAIQVWEKLGTEEDLVIIGLNERGYAAALELSGYIDDYLSTKAQVHQYEVTGNNAESSLPECNDKFVLLVDDVIFSGKTMFEALSGVCNIYEPKTIEIAVLIDRGHRKYPLLTGMSGIEVPTKLGEHIEVMLKNSKLEEAILFKNS